MTDQSALISYEFEGFRVDPRQRLLFAHGESTPVALPPRVFDTLLCFVEQPGELLSKTALTKAVWPNVVVEENSLNQNISMLRRVLGETPSEHRFIVTATGRGYRFVAPVTTVRAAPATVEQPGAAVSRASLPSPDLHAYQLYMQALAVSQRPSFENVKGAIDLLREALRRDAKFARAMSLLAVQYTTCVIFDFPIAGALDAAEHEAGLALMLDPHDGATHCAAGIVECLRGNWSSSEARFRAARALAEDPFTSGLRCVHLTHSVGHIRRGLREAEEAFRAAPTLLIGAHMLASAHLYLGADAEAIRYCDLSVELGQSRTLAPLPDIYAQVALRARRFAEAAAQLESSISPQMRAAGGVEAIREFCAALEDASHLAAANLALDRLECEIEPSDLDQPMRKRLILWRTMLGNLDAAYSLIERSLDHFAQAGTVGSAWGFLWLPEMQPFRRDPRFQQFVARMRLIDYWREYGPPDGCELRGEVLVCG